MDQLQANAVRCHEQAERMRNLALLERDPTRQRLLFAVAEQYYLLHDQLVELQRNVMFLGREADRTVAN